MSSSLTEENEQKQLIDRIITLEAENRGLRQALEDMKQEKPPSPEEIFGWVQTYQTLPAYRSERKIAFIRLVMAGFDPLKYIGSAAPL